MNAKNLQTAKYVSWSIASVCWVVLLLGNTKNNPLTAVTFVFIMLGIIFAALQDKQQKN